MTDLLEQYGEELVEYAEDKRFCSGAYSHSIADNINGLDTHQVSFLFEEIEETLEGDVDTERPRSNGYNTRYNLELVRENRDDIILKGDTQNV